MDLVPNTTPSSLPLGQTLHKLSLMALWQHLIKANEKLGLGPVGCLRLWRNQDPLRTYVLVLIGTFQNEMRSPAGWLILANA